jgi:hypothetical protein
MKIYHIMVRLVFLVFLLSSFTLHAETDIQAYNESVQLGEGKVDKFIESLKSGDPNRIRESTLEIQRDPAAIKQLNKRSNFVKQKFVQTTDNIQSETINNIRAKVAKEYGVPPEKVRVRTTTNPSSEIKAGHDWDVTVSIEGQGEIPLDDIVERTVKGAKTDKVKAKGAKSIVEESYFEAATGKPASSKSQVENFSKSHHVEVTNKTHAEAYEGGKKFIDNPADYNVKDTERLSKTIEHKSNLDRNKALEFQSQGKTGKAQIYKGEQARQYTKQYDKIIEPRIKAMGGKIPPKVAEGTKILKMIGQKVPGTDVTFTPKDAEIALAKLGETPESIIQKGSSLVESAEKLLPKKAYLKTVKDIGTGAIVAITIFSTAEDIKEAAKKGDAKAVAKILADNATGGAVSITEQNVEKYGDYQEFKNKIDYANKTEYEAYILRAGKALRENDVSPEETEKIMNAMRNEDLSAYKKKLSELQKNGKNISVKPPNLTGRSWKSFFVDGDERLDTRTADVFIAIGDGILAMPGKTKKFLSEANEDLYEIFGGIQINKDGTADINAGIFEKGVITELYNQKVESAGNLLDIAKNEYRTYSINKEIEEQKERKDKFEQQKEIRDKLIAQGLSFEDANNIAKKAAHEGDWKDFRKARQDIQANRDAEEKAAKAGIYPEDAGPFLNCLCQECGGSLGGYFAPGVKGEYGSGPCMCKGPLTIWNTPIPSSSERELECYNSITAGNYAKDQAIFDKWRKQARDENAQSVVEELAEVHELAKDESTLSEAADLFNRIQDMLYPRDKQAVRDKVEPKLAARAHLEMEQGELDKAIATSTVANKVAGDSQNRKYPLHRFATWKNNWSAAKEKTFPEIYDCLNKGRMIQAENKLRLLHKYMETPKDSSFLPPSYKDPEYRALLDAYQKKKREYELVISNTWKDSERLVRERDPRSSVKLITETLNNWEHSASNVTSLKNEIKNRLALFVQKAEAQATMGDKYLAAGDLAAALSEYGQSVNRQKDAAVQQKLDALLGRKEKGRESRIAGDDYRREKDIAKAIESYKSSISRWPDTYLSGVIAQLEKQLAEQRDTPKKEAVAQTKKVQPATETKPGGSVMSAGTLTGVAKPGGTSASPQVIAAAGVNGNTLELITVQLDPGLSRVIKLHITEASELTAKGRSDSARIGEVEFYAKGQKTAASKVTATSVFSGGYSVEQVMDGNRQYGYIAVKAIGWASTQKSGGDDWLTFHFAEPVDISKVVITTAPTRPYRLHSFSVMKYGEQGSEQKAGAIDGTKNNLEQNKQAQEEEFNHLISAGYQQEQQGRLSKAIGFYKKALTIHADGKVSSHVHDLEQRIELERDKEKQFSKKVAQKNSTPWSGAYHSKESFADGHTVQDLTLHLTQKGEQLSGQITLKLFTQGNLYSNDTSSVNGSCHGRTGTIVVNGESMNLNLSPDGNSLTDTDGLSLKRVK